MLTKNHYVNVVQAICIGPFFAEVLQTLPSLFHCWNGYQSSIAHRAKDFVHIQALWGVAWGLALWWEGDWICEYFFRATGGVFAVLLGAGLHYCWFFCCLGAVGE